MANFTDKEIEYVTDRIMKGADLHDSLRSDFSANPHQVVDWFQGMNKKNYETLGYEL